MTAAHTCEAPAADATQCPAKEWTHEEKAIAETRKHALVALGAGLIPLFLVDLTAITATQMRLVYQVAKIYGVPFKANLAKTIISTVVGGAGVPYAAYPIMVSALKMIPGLGTAAGMVSMPVIAAASTYALGKVFIQHFEAGGTLLDFNPAAMRDYYYQQFTEGKTLAEEHQKQS